LKYLQVLMRLHMLHDAVSHHELRFASDGRGYEALDYASFQAFTKIFMHTKATNINISCTRKIKLVRSKD